jgi:hypothetical protein
MSATQLLLSAEEFRLLAYLRGYADGWGDRYHLDPVYVQEQLELTIDSMDRASLRLAELGFVTVHEHGLSGTIDGVDVSKAYPLRMSDICLTEKGWSCLRVVGSDLDQHL